MRVLQVCCALLVALCVGAVAQLSAAATWTVEKDGSGDYEVIQDALDASAPGDSILIGPGRFDTIRPGNSIESGWPIAVVIWLKTANVTVIGAGVDQTIIGPALDDLPTPNAHSSTGAMKGRYGRTGGERH